LAATVSLDGDAIALLAALHGGGDAVGWRHRWVEIFLVFCEIAKKKKHVPTPLDPFRSLIGPPISTREGPIRGSNTYWVRIF
jgi:hypothetical protein